MTKDIKYHVTDLWVCEASIYAGRNWVNVHTL